jgi:urea transport system permease protein
MKPMPKKYLGFLCGVLMSARALSAPANPDTPGLRRDLVQAILGHGASRQRLLGSLADSSAGLVRQVLLAWARDEVYLYQPPGGARVPVLLEDQQDAQGKARAIRISDGRIVTDAKGRDLRFDPNTMTTADTDARLRQLIQQTLDKLALSDPDPSQRRSAIMKLGYSGKEAYVPFLRAHLATERNRRVRRAIGVAIALLQLNDPNPSVQVTGARQLAALDAIGSVDRLRRLSNDAKAGADVRQAAKQSVSFIQEHMARVNFFGTLFRGLSLGSILLVVALGLAITFGLMGVINMAHGEMIAVGAYTCYVMQNLFGAGFGFSITLPFHFAGKPIAFGLHLPGLNATGALYQSYFLFALPLSFLTAALVGLAVERAIIRFLYRRPLESLLATWGVSLCMQQCFRMVFGANNVQVNSPGWLLGHFTIDDVLLDYSRLFVISFAVVIVGATWLLLTRTPLGLLIRAVMQNRDMASCMGVRTQRINMLTFAFGSGLAGLAGAFLSQIGNVGPSLGQTYIVDSFMTVVVGGVGSILGTVCSAFGIGTADEVLQQALGSPVLGKIIVLAAIILFLQWKPGGLFALRSRSLD